MGISFERFRCRLLSPTPAPPPSAVRMTLTVVHRRKVYMLSALASSTVDELKEMLAERMAVPTSKMRLIYMFEELQDDRIWFWFPFLKMSCCVCICSCCVFLCCALLVCMLRLFGNVFASCFFVVLFSAFRSPRTLESYGVPARAQLILRLKPTRAKGQAKLKVKGKAKGKATPAKSKARGSRSSMCFWSSDEGDECDATGGAF